MYSHEIEEYIRQHNYRLSYPQLQVLIDRRINPQVYKFKYKDISHEYELWTTDNYYFRFNAMSYNDYIGQVKHDVTKEGDFMHYDHYRLYVSLHGEPYTHIVSSSDIQHIFLPMDIFILQQEHQHARYLVIQNTNQEDTQLYLGFGNKLDYLRFKKQQLEQLQQKENTKQI